jgi:hypothetical protein
MRGQAYRCGWSIQGAANGQASPVADRGFIHRFLQHVLPEGFVKVRYYGFLSSGCRPRLAAIRQQPDNPPVGQSPALDSADVAETDNDLADDPAPNPILLCPACGQVMQGRPIPRPQCRCPP